MPSKPHSEIESLVGETRTSVTDLRIERGKVAEFARALGEDDPVFSDQTVARERGHPAIPAPPTFSRVWMFDHNQPDDLPGYRGFDLGLDTARTVHGEQVYEFDRPVYVGETLDGETTLLDVSEHAGSRGGEMTVAVYETVYYDEDGERTLTERTTLVETAETEDEDEEDDSDDGSTATDRSRAPDGDLVETLDRVDFARYAGASGDFTRYHLDEPWTTDRGYESVFAQGMLTCGLATRVLTDRYDVEQLVGLETRFSGIVWPSDTLSVTCERATTDETDETDATRRLSLSVVNQYGETVLNGHADVAPDRSPGEAVDAIPSRGDR